MTSSLILLNGSSPGATLRLMPADSIITIGRDRERDFPLDDDRTSRLHAKVCRRAERWHIEDCQSLNGTYVNSQPVQQTVLESGDLIRIGQRLLLFTEDEDDHNELRMKASRLTSTTMFGKSLSGDKLGALVEKSLSDSMSRVVRDSAVLCRLANQLHRASDTKSLVRAAMDALTDGIAADMATVWLIGADGRLRCAGKLGGDPASNGVEAHPGRPNRTSSGRDPHVLASLAIEKDKAFLIEEPQTGESPTETWRDTPSSVGAAIGVPIRGQRASLGAIECHRDQHRKPFDRSDLDFTIVVAHQAGLALENLDHRQRLELANVELRRRLATETKLAGSSPTMRDVLDKIARVGPTASTVLILGESGTGKELVAQSIHETSSCKAGPYVAVNCAAFSESLLESELFGHEAGAFTGADRRRIGQFERAHRGTIFLDEVGEMSLACQAKLLRLLEGHPFQRLGGQDQFQVNVRVVAATNRDLLELAKQGRFREDLYYRLRVIDIHLPPLRERGDDVIELATMFLTHFRRQLGRGPSRLSMTAVEALQSYHWPGNVRELKNAIERAVVLGGSEELLPADLGLPHTAPPPAPPTQLMSLEEAQRRHIAYVLNQVDGNKTEACRILQIGRGTLYKKLGKTEQSTSSS